MRQQFFLGQNRRGNWAALDLNFVQIKRQKHAEKAGFLRMLFTASAHLGPKRRPSFEWGLSCQERKPAPKI